MSIWRRRRQEFPADHRRRSLNTNMNSRLPYDSCTLYIDNIPRGTGRWEVKEFFGRFGDVARVYVTDKNRSWSSAGFAFVNFRRSRDRMVLLQSQDDFWFKGRRLYIGVEAKSRQSMYRSQLHDRRRHSSQSHSLDYYGAGIRTNHENDGQRNLPHWSQHKIVRQEWRPKVQHIEREEKHGKRLRTIELDEVSENVAWLNLSLVMKSQESRSYMNVFELLGRELDHPFKLIVINHYTFLVCFENEEHRELALKQKMKLAAFFHTVEPWKSYDRADTRRVWIAIKGVPLEVWTRDNIVKVASLFGEVIEVEECSIDGVAMEEARVRVLTREMGFISEEILLTVGSLGISVFVTECYHMGSDSWTVKHGQFSRMVDSVDPQNGDHYNDGMVGNSVVQESSCHANVDMVEGAQGSGSGSCQKTITANVAYDLGNEEQLLNTQRQREDGNDMVLHGPPGFEGILNVVVNGENIQNSNAMEDPTNAPISMPSSDSNIAEQAVALVKLLDGQVEDESIAKAVIVSQLRSQRLAQKNP